MTGGGILEGDDDDDTETDEAGNGICGAGAGMGEPRSQTGASEEGADTDEAGWRQACICSDT